MTALPTIVILGPHGQPLRINQKDFVPGRLLTWEQAQEKARELAARPMAELRAMARAQGVEPGPRTTKLKLSLRLLSAHHQ